MWLITKNSFVSVVQCPDRPNHVLVRARRRGDLARLFPKKKRFIQKTEHDRYMWQLTIPRLHFARIISGYIFNRLTYSSFIDAQEKDSQAWNVFLSDVYRAGMNLESRAYSRTAE